MIFDVQTIPHGQQRYPTVGDYWETGDADIPPGIVVHFRVSQLKDQRYEWLVLIHEVVEYFLVKLAKIPILNIDIFDKRFEETRLPENTDEPGDHPDAPYRRQHQLATVVERVCAVIFGVHWEDYERACNEL